MFNALSLGIYLRLPHINGVAESKRLTAFIDNCWNHKQEWLNTVGVLTVIARADAIFARFT